MTRIRRPRSRPIAVFSALPPRETGSAFFQPAHQQYAAQRCDVVELFNRYRMQVIATPAHAYATSAARLPRAKLAERSTGELGGRPSRDRELTATGGRPWGRTATRAGIADRVGCSSTPKARRFPPRTTGSVSAVEATPTIASSLEQVRLHAMRRHTSASQTAVRLAPIPLATSEQKRGDNSAPPRVGTSSTPHRHCRPNRG